MNIETKWKELKPEDKRDITVGLYVRGIKSRKELQNGGLIEVAMAGRRVRESMNINASLMAEELGESVAIRLGLRG